MGPLALPEYYKRSRGAFSGGLTFEGGNGFFKSSKVAQGPKDSPAPLITYRVKYYLKGEGGIYGYDHFDYTKEKEVKIR